MKLRRKNMPRFFRHTVVGPAGSRTNSQCVEARGYLLADRGRAPGSGGVWGWGTAEAPTSPFRVCQMAHLSKKATQGRITRRTKKLIRCVKSLTFRSHVGKAAHADLSTKVWML